MEERGQILNLLTKKRTREKNMKEIKAYFRIIKGEEVVHALEEAGAPGVIAVVEVKCIGNALNTDKAKYSIEYAEKVSPATKIELVCDDEDVEKFVSIIREKAFTGSDAGEIVVSDVRKTVML